MSTCVPVAPRAAPRVCSGPAAGAARLAAGLLVAFPTETSWGLGASARQPRAIARLFAWKRRAPTAALSVLVGGLADVEALGCEVPPAAAELAAAHWPGPLTLVLRCRAALAPGVAARDGTVGLRCSPHPGARALLRAADAVGAGPVTATSFNRASAPPVQTRAAAFRLCAEDPEGPFLLATGPDAGNEAASTIVRVVGERLTVLRAGPIRP